MVSSSSNLYATLQKIVRNMDLDGNGVISLKEFRPVYLKLNPLGTDKDVTRVFKQIDSDNSGTISCEELAKHYGFHFRSDHTVDGEVDTAGMSDEQLIELMHLNSIASDIALRRTIAADSEVHEGKMRDAKAVLEEQRKLMAMSNAHRLEIRRRSSKMAEIVHLLKGSGASVKRHSTQPEADMLDACALGDFAAVDSLLKEGVDPAICDDKGEGALHKLCRIGGLSASTTASKLVSKGVELDYQDRNGKTAAHIAAEYGHVDLLAWLFAKGADARLATVEGWTILHEAVFHGDAKCVELLLHMHNGPGVNTRDSHGRTALHIAAYRAPEEMLRLLCAQRTAPRACDMRGRGGERG
jgi:ankyrin repeat protein